MSPFFTVYYFTSWYIIYRNVLLLYVYLFHGNAFYLHFSQYTILLSSSLYVETSNCFMSTYFTDMIVSCLPFSRYTILRSGTLHVGTSNCFMYTYFTINCFTFWYIICKNVYFFTVYNFTFWNIICRNV